MAVRYFTIITISFLLLNCSSHRFGVKAGINYSDFSHGETVGESSYVAGITTERQTSENLFVGFDILTSSRSVVLKNQISPRMSGDGYLIYDFRIKLQFVEFAYIIKYSLFKQNSWSISPYIGPSLSLAYDKSVTLRTEGNDDLPPGLADIEIIDGGSFLSSLNGDLGINLGFNVKYEPVYLDFRYYHGFLPLGRAAKKSGFDQKWRTLEVMVGYMF